MSFNLPAMVDMAMTPKERAENAPVMPTSEYDGPKYPWGLSISLDEDALEKLEVDFESIEVGETYHLFVLAKVTAKSNSERESGEPRKCVEMQITHMGAESEDAEDKEKTPTRSKMYKKK